MTVDRPVAEVLQGLADHQPAHQKTLIEAVDSIHAHRLVAEGLGKCEHRGLAEEGASGWMLTPRGAKIVRAEFGADVAAVVPDAAPGEPIPDGGTDRARISDPHHKRLQPGRQHRPCVICGGGIVVGHAIRHTDEGMAHEDCEDRWQDLFDATARPPERTCPECGFAAHTERWACPECATVLEPNATAFNLGVER